MPCWLQARSKGRSLAVAEGSVLGEVGKLKAVIGEDDLDFIGIGFEELFEERSACRCRAR